MGKSNPRLDRRKKLMMDIDSIAANLDALSVDPDATHDQSRHLASAVRMLLPAFTPTKADDMADLGCFLDKHESTKGERAAGGGGRRRTPGGRKPKPGRRPAPDNPASPLPSPIAGDLPTRPDPGGNLADLVKVLTCAYFKIAGHSLQNQEHYPLQSAGYAGMAMALKAILLIVCKEPTGAGLDALWVWAGIADQKLQGDWEKRLNKAEVLEEWLGWD